MRHTQSFLKRNAAGLNSAPQQGGRDAGPRNN